MPNNKDTTTFKDRLEDTLRKLGRYYVVGGDDQMDEPEAVEAILASIDEVIGEDELVDLSKEAEWHEFDLDERAKEANNRLRAKLRSKFGISD